MVLTCAICGFRAKPGCGIKFHRLPLRNPTALKKLLPLLSIYRKNIPISKYTRICSQHFDGRGKKRQVSRTSPGRCLEKRGNDIEILVQACKQEANLTDNGNLFILAEACEQEEKILHNAPDGLIGLDLLSEACNEKEYLKTTVDEVDLCSNLDVKTNHSISSKSVQTDANEMLCVQNVINNKRKLKYFTGFADAELFWICFNFVTYGQMSVDKRYALSLEEQFLLVLVRLKLGITIELLAYMFGISDSTVGSIFDSWVEIMFRRFKILNIWPSREEILNTMSQSVAKKYPNLRCIIDCTEIKIPHPKNPSAQQLTFSNYKNCNTAKALIGIAPTGAISFISDLYGGCISDKEITKLSGILEKCQEGDVVLADRGFTIQEYTTAYGIELNIPAFKEHGKQLDPYDVANSRRIANTRIHVERAIGRIKNYQILNNIGSVYMLPKLNKICYICSMLSNFKEVLIK